MKRVHHHTCIKCERAIACDAPISWDYEPPAAPCSLEEDDPNRDWLCEDCENDCDECRTCGARYYADGVDGECADCADQREDERRGAQ